MYHWTLAEQFTSVRDLWLIFAQTSNNSSWPLFVFSCHWPIGYTKRKQISIFPDKKSNQEVHLQELGCEEFGFITCIKYVNIQSFRQMRCIVSLNKFEDVCIKIVKKNSLFCLFKRKELVTWKFHKYLFLRIRSVWIFQVHNKPLKKIFFIIKFKIPSFRKYMRETWI